MFRFKNNKNKNMIEITLVMDPDYLEDVATSRVTHPKSNVKKGRRYSDQQLADYNDFVESIISVITHFQFQIVDEYQSGESYAYYVEFLPVDENGNAWDESITIKFRLADHSNIGMDSPIQRDRKLGQPIKLLKSFFIGSEQYPGVIDVVNAVKQICLGLKAGDYSILNKF